MKLSRSLKATITKYKIVDQVSELLREYAMIIGLGHYKRTGKNAFAKFLRDALQAHCQVRITSFASKLKQICHDLYGWAGLREESFYETEPGASLREVVLPDIGKSPRQIWIDFGTPAVREHVYEPTWRDYILKQPSKCDVLIITDVRFPNEAEGIKATGGKLIKIERPGYAPGLDVADQALIRYTGWDQIVIALNLDELQTAAQRLAVEIIQTFPRQVSLHFPGESVKFNRSFT